MDQELRVGTGHPAGRFSLGPLTGEVRTQPDEFTTLRVPDGGPAARQPDRLTRPVASLVMTYLLGPASPTRVAVSVVPVLSASTRTTSLVVIWVVVAACLPLWTLVLGSSV